MTVFSTCDIDQSPRVRRVTTQRCNDEPVSRFHPSLSDQQAFALLFESNSTRNLLRNTVDAIRRLREPSLDGDAIFTLGSIGVEKALKIMLGCAFLEDRGTWPTKNELRGWGHNIERLLTLLTERVRTGLADTTARGYSQGLHDRMQSPDILPALMATFSRYGRSGRFHYLDVLATDLPSEYDAPNHLWDDVERQTVDTRPHLRRLPKESMEDFGSYLSAVSSAIADELEVWWFCLHRLGVQGCFGAAGKNIGWDIWPPGRPSPQL
ncbi:hypothetical protein [Microbacterium sp. SORGH_AS_0421]|uniref:hypothetical protein n=1 Tax=Microbacterium sp. SORGH_AS_0421 TaxID=3041768 RepID=UPI002792ABD6|nr:hypothetical protein [Microbacterium sp. SORGH_AS_0421]MDQ1177272.1 hypothetical protein [Microbacterium sp. SORGH_AS_0421]